MARRYKRLGGRTEAEARALLLDALKGFADNLRTVGTAPDERLAWLEDFLRRELPADAAGRDREAALLNAFALHHAQAWGGGGIDTTARLQQLVEPNDLPMIQQAVRDVLDKLIPLESQSINEAPSGAWLPVAVGDGLIWHPRRGVRLVTRGAGLPQVLASVADLLVSLGPRLQRCETPSCRRLFAIRRRGQKRCKPSCGTTERVREWREKNAERLSANRHQQYARKVKTRLHPSVRVTRRKKG